MNESYTQQEAAADEWGDHVNRCTIAAGQAQDIAAEYDELAGQVAHLRDRLGSMAAYTVVSPQDGEKESPQLLQSPAIARVHRDSIA
ncbi:MAG: hypothetical protein LC792_00395, partial [Actinobacteria bacterium]|nr:hypothetical protein [Actinomycetota bacterium]